jgi:hypothetical protein
MNNESIILLIRELKKTDNKSNIYKKKYENLRNIVLEDLIQNDSQIQQIFEENQKLLTNTKIICNVYREGSTFYGTHATTLKGNIRNNGFCYMEVDKLSPAFTISQRYYPVQFIGNIRFDGEIHLKLTKKKLPLIGSRVPVEFQGEIDEKGKIKLDLTKSSFEIAGGRFVQRILFDPFSGDESKRQQFLKNKAIILNKFQEYLLDLDGFSTF